MLTSRAEGVIQKVVSHLSNEPGVAALVLAGSQVAGNKFPADEFSDIEMYVVANDAEFEQVETVVSNIEKIFDQDEVVLAYKNQWAGWSVLFRNLLRLEMPLVKASDEQAFARSGEQKIEVLYAKPGFQLKKSAADAVIESDVRKNIEEAVKDFWYMAVYVAQHIGRGEVWLARGAMHISMQGKVKRLIEELYHPELLKLDRDRRIELTWTREELEILKATSCEYDKSEVVKVFWQNIKYMKIMLDKLGAGKEVFERYERKLTPEIQAILDREL